MTTKSAPACRAARQAGADFVVIGTVVEEQPQGGAGLEAFVEAVR